MSICCKYDDDMLTPTGYPPPNTAAGTVRKFECCGSDCLGLARETTQRRAGVAMSGGKGNPPRGVIRYFESAVESTVAVGDSLGYMTHMIGGVRLDTGYCGEQQRAGT